jgi:CO/xanthine dehydrogenase FAD-binding subunit
MLKQASREIGAVQIQNSGTIGGNLCTASPAADSVPCLMALDAEVEMSSVRGKRRLGLGDFLTGARQTALQPDELVTAICIPQSSEAGISAFSKLGARHYLVISIAMVAARLVVDGGKITDARIAIGACAPVAIRQQELETALNGASVANAPMIARDMQPEISASLTPIDDVRASADYRREAAARMVGRIIADLCSEAS